MTESLTLWHSRRSNYLEVVIAVDDGNVQSKMQSIRGRYSVQRRWLITSTHHTAKTTATIPVLLVLLTTMQAVPISTFTPTTTIRFTISTRLAIAVPFFLTPFSSLAVAFIVAAAVMTVDSVPWRQVNNGHLVIENVGQGNHAVPVHWVYAKSTGGYEGGGCGEGFQRHRLRGEAVGVQGDQRGHMGLKVLSYISPREEVERRKLIKIPI